MENTNNQIPEVQASNPVVSSTPTIGSQKNNKTLIIVGSVVTLLLVVTTVAVGTYITTKQKNDSQSKVSDISNEKTTQTPAPTSTLSKEYVDPDTNLTFNYSSEKISREKNETYAMTTIENVQTSEKLLIKQILVGRGGDPVTYLEKTYSSLFTDAKNDIVIKIYSKTDNSMTYSDFYTTFSGEKENKFGYSTIHFPGLNYAANVTLLNAKDDQSTTFDALVKTIRQSEVISGSTSIPTTTSLPVTTSVSTYNYTLEKPNFSFIYNSSLKFDPNSKSSDGAIRIDAFSQTNSKVRYGIILIDASAYKVDYTGFSSLEEYYISYYTPTEVVQISKFSKETVNGKSLYYGDAGVTGRMTYNVSAYGTKLSDKYYLIVSSNITDSNKPHSMSKEYMKQIINSFVLK